MTSPLCGAFVKTFSVQCLTNGNAVSSAPEPMAELLGSCLRLQLLFRCVKLDEHRAGGSSGGRWIREPHRKWSAKLGYFHCKVSRHSQNFVITLWSIMRDDNFDFCWFFLHSKIHIDPL